MDIESFKKAASQIKPWLKRTPIIKYQTAYLKCENLQITGSFKVRGCLNAMLESDRSIPKITRSSGNFGQAMAWAGQQLGIPTTVVMPDKTSAVKIQKTKDFGANVVLAGPSYDACENTVQQMIRESKLQYIPPSDDDHVILGQGTIALEILDELSEVEYLYGPLGGGGLMSGCAAAMKLLKPNSKVIAVEPSGANDYALSRKQGMPISKVAETIADGLRSPCVGKRNWPLLQKYVDEVQEVSDAQIIETMRLLYRTTGIMVEPSGIVSLAAFMAKPKQNAVCIISGGNIDRESFLKLIK